MAARAMRGGGERGSIERGKSKGFGNSTGDWVAEGAETVIIGGKTNAMAVTIEQSES